MRSDIHAFALLHFLKTPERQFRSRALDNKNFVDILITDPYLFWNMPLLKGERASRAGERENHVYLIGVNNPLEN